MPKVQLKFPPPKLSHLVTVYSGSYKSPPTSSCHRYVTSQACRSCTSKDTSPGQKKKKEEEARDTFLLKSITTTNVLHQSLFAQAMIRNSILNKRQELTSNSAKQKLRVLNSHEFGLSKALSGHKFPCISRVWLSPNLHLPAQERICEAFNGGRRQRTWLQTHNQTRAARTHLYCRGCAPTHVHTDALRITNPLQHLNFEIFGSRCYSSQT